MSSVSSIRFQSIATFKNAIPSYLVNQDSELSRVGAIVCYLEGSESLLANTTPTMKIASPVKTQICPITTRFNRYKEAPVDKTKMPVRKAFEAINRSSHKSILYFAAAIIIILTVYYVPNYFFLEKATAEHTAILLNSLGVSVQTKVLNGSVFLENIKIVKDCTGVQVVAVFLGLIIPVPDAPLKKKILTLAAVFVLLYGANLLRIGLEFSLVYLNMLPWSLAHYPLSLLLGIAGVFMLVFVANRLMPEFGNFLFSIRHI